MNQDKCCNLYNIVLLLIQEEKQIPKLERMIKMKEEMFKGLEQSRTEFNDWSGRAAIFIDFEEKEAFCHVHEIPDYHDEAVVCIIHKGDLQGRNFRIGKDRLDSLVMAKFKKYNAGWDRMDLEDDYHFAEYISGN